MRQVAKALGLGMALGWLGAGIAVAQDSDLLTKGKSIYETRCVICHRAEGKGDGDIGGMFETRPGDLSNLAGGADGFPFDAVLAKVDGRKIVMGHGTEMPVWGEYFMVEALEDRGINPKDAADIVNGRLAALV